MIKASDVSALTSALDWRLVSSGSPPNSKSNSKYSAAFSSGCVGRQPASARAARKLMSGCKRQMVSSSGEQGQGHTAEIIITSLFFSFLSATLTASSMAWFSLGVTL